MPISIKDLEIKCGNVTVSTLDLTEIRIDPTETKLRGKIVCDSNGAVIETTYIFPTHKVTFDFRK